MRFFRHAFQLLALVFIVGLLPGCIITQRWVEADNASGQGQGPERNREKMIYHFYSPSKIKSLDAVKAGDAYSTAVMSEIYQGLMQYSYLKRPYQVEPCLGFPEISEDGLTYTFHIRKGVYFHDHPCFPDGKGRELNAKDFEFSWKRLAQVADAEGWWVFDEKIVGLNDFHDTWLGRGFDEVDWEEPVEGIDVVDDYTLRIQLVKPYPQLLYVLAMTYTAAVPREEIEYYGDEAVNFAVGTGPYMFKEWVRGSKVVLVRNPNYMTETYPFPGPSAEPEDLRKGLYDDAGRRLPFCDEVIFSIIIESAPQWLSFLNGELDRSAIPKDNYDSAIGPGRELTPDLRDKGIDLQISPRLDITYTAMNMEDPVLGPNRKLRQAIASATFIEDQIGLFYNNRGISAQGPIPPGMGGYDPDFQSPWKPSDLDRARRLMAEAGYPYVPGRFAVEIDYEMSGESTTNRQMAEYFTSRMADIGIKINIVTNTWPAFTEKIKKKQAQIWGIAWNADYPDAENFLQLFYGPNQAPGPNGSNYQNPEFDALFERARIMQDSPERNDLYSQLAKMVVEDCPWAFGIHREQFALSQSWLKNYKYNEMRHGFIKYLRVDMDERRRMRLEKFNNPVEE
jgi:ABC-type transport system substrate-binding protein